MLHNQPMNQRYSVEHRRQAGKPIYVVIDTLVGDVIYRSTRKRDADSWASVWNGGSTMNLPALGVKA